MNKSITQDVLARQSLVKFALKHSLTAAAVRFGKHKSYIHYWLKKYDGTPESLCKQSTRPHHHPNEHTPEELKWIEDYKRRMPDSSLIDVWVSLKENKNYSRSIPGLFRAMKRLGYYGGRKKVKPPKAGKMEEMLFPGQKIQIDVKYVPKGCVKAEIPVKLYQFTAIDEFSRLRYLEGFDDNSSYTAKVFLMHALEYFHRNYGFKVLMVQTDNGREFTNRFDRYPKETLFEKTLTKLGIPHKLIRPYTPRHNGKVERSHREDQKRFYDKRTFYSLPDLNKQLSEHLRYTNNRPMRPLKYLSPINYIKQFYLDTGMICG
jgi:transposase InsO family protein